eukprot:TRINITY_DN4188_c0_g1_i2.p1 TRINITY_DN4188_c0_g1~~TRINITY_DN4188_c0_g1_i2.p1  ORF type:complete len:184 (-),score=30.20 TRINITY_DN4188_c0_g1_i2:900-1421(-)
MPLFTLSINILGVISCICAADAFSITGAHAAAENVQQLKASANAHQEAAPEGDLTANFMKARAGFSAEDSAPIYAYTRALIQAKGDLLDALEESEGRLTDDIMATCAALVQVSPVGAPINCRSLLHGSWLHAASLLPDVSLGEGCEIAPLLQAIGGQLEWTEVEDEIRYVISV